MVILRATFFKTTAPHDHSLKVRSYPVGVSCPLVCQSWKLCEKLYNPFVQTNDANQWFEEAKATFEVFGPVLIPPEENQERSVDFWLIGHGTHHAKYVFVYLVVRLLETKNNLVAILSAF